MGLFDGVRRALGLHVHDWEVVDVQEEQVQQAPRWGLNIEKGSDVMPDKFVSISVPALTLKCKTCGKSRRTRQLS